MTQILMKTLAEDVTLPVRGRKPYASLEVLLNDEENLPFDYYPRLVVCHSRVSIHVTDPQIRWLMLEPMDDIRDRYMIPVGSRVVGSREHVELSMTFMNIDGRAKVYRKGEPFMRVVLPTHVHPANVELLSVKQMPGEPE